MTTLIILIFRGNLFLSIPYICLIVMVLQLSFPKPVMSVTWMSRSEGMVMWFSPGNEARGGQLKRGRGEWRQFENKHS
jgi:hypothetical protein